ncbi:MAG TPA: hypothetical protein VFO86_12850 [Terriglobia bacterium]|nr:hypothetical protein [Terriglobia bacterium]
MENKLHSVFNAYEEIQFNGVRLAHQTTETPDSVRWFEIEIFRTESGKYIIHRIGVSLVYHMMNGPCVGRGTPTRFDKLNNDAMPCLTCKPPLEVDDDLSYTVSAEQDRHSAQVCRGDEIQQRLMVRPSRGDAFLSSPARKALDQAIAADPSLQTSTVRFID